ncbi:hypothetical protein PAQ31011_02411 [Pandoraea aquatica]|uniref:Transmembrane protein n=1 Tax=Pandoraea aquatica TaxID=2508290 RepID=A0A5E4V241_9BURK|nr:hypothetical protein [Pandoraea aquatica]VVE06288.1 hypothetical protein PAQ31011_02411 [Pandoraea aquatica]
MTDPSKNELTEMVERLINAAFAAVYVFIFIAAPIYGTLKLKKALRHLRTATDKSERKYWRDELRMACCIVYISVVIYVHIFQDLFLLPLSFENKARVMHWVDAVLGLPGALMYAVVLHRRALDYDVQDFLVAALLVSGAALLYYIAKSSLKVNGGVNEDGVWVPSRAESQRRWAKFEEEEAESRAITKRMIAHEMDDPRSDRERWNTLSKAQQQREQEQWEAERDELYRLSDACPRSSYFDKKS